MYIVFLICGWNIKLLGNYQHNKMRTVIQLIFQMKNYKKWYWINNIQIGLNSDIGLEIYQGQRHKQNMKKIKYIKNAISPLHTIVSSVSQWNIKFLAIDLTCEKNRTMFLTVPKSGINNIIVWTGFSEFVIRNLMNSLDFPDLLSSCDHSFTELKRS